ncbi:hypothetical protein A6A19_00390 [Actinobacillus delphinicola]|uniref:TrbC/VirB2 family protein n=1 Tax=Actinobacillus delphinicola TaxID=51161 RepID=UPI002441641B|nr:TrbC/VirB2 family protein [Actinobacillus delphinicola]MDG6896504.1 hypothetical protein [Actinobacillus delphinicola]
MNLNKLKNILLTTTLTLVSDPIFAAGIEKANKVLNKVEIALHSVAVVSVTIAVFLSGYKIVFGGQTLREVSPILIGGLIVGSASEIANLFVG